MKPFVASIIVSAMLAGSPNVGIGPGSLMALTFSPKAFCGQIIVFGLHVFSLAISLAGSNCWTLG
jgi:hypothetical protein